MAEREVVKEGDIWSTLDKKIRVYIVAAGPKRVQYRIIPGWRMRQSSTGSMLSRYPHREIRPDPNDVWESS